MMNETGGLNNVGNAHRAASKCKTRPDVLLCNELGKQWKNPSVEEVKEQRQHSKHGQVSVLE